jgi:predicted Zn-dependent peptidase
MNVIRNQFRKASKFGLLIFIVLTFIGLSFAQTGTNIASQAALVKEFDVNGLKVLIKRRPNSSTVAAGLFLRGGARNLTAENAGIEDFMLNVATEGSQKFPRETLRRELARTASNISSGTNYDFSVLALASTRQNFDRSWEIFTDIALNPAFTPNAVELTREKLLTSLRDDEDDPDGFLQVLVNRTINAKTSYENDPSGTIENIGKFSTQDLRAYHQKVMQTSRLLLVIVGDLDATALQQKIAASFGKLPRGDYKEPAFSPFDFSKRPTISKAFLTLLRSTIRTFTRCVLLLRFCVTAFLKKSGTNEIFLTRQVPIWEVWESILPIFM